MKSFQQDGAKRKHLSKRPQYGLPDDRKPDLEKKQVRIVTRV